MQIKEHTMKDQANSKKIILISFVLIGFAALTRLLPHPSNFTALGAMALFAGVTFRSYKWAYLLPFTVLFLTDMVLGLHFSMLPVYGCIGLTVWLGTRLKGQPGAVKIGLLSLVSSSLFFLVTNLPIWYADLSLYPITLEGTIQSYTMGLPFYRNQVFGDFIYNGLIFGIYHVFAGSKKLNLA